MTEERHTDEELAEAEEAVQRPAPGPAGSSEAGSEAQVETQVEARGEAQGEAGVGTDAGAASSTTEDDGAGGSSATAESDELTVTRMELAERTSDLQRLQAEFLNYKRRIDRDRELITQNARYQVLVPIIEVLDTIDRAREHGELDEGFRAVADQLERVVTGLGLTKYGEPGEPFDPNLHEALSHIGEDPDVEVTTCKVVAKAGYRIGDRVVRAAQVLVVDPATG